MALSDILFFEAKDHVAELGAGTWTGSLNDEVSESVMDTEHVLGWPAEAQVQIGVDYGPTGTEYEGTYAPSGAAAYRVIGSAVVRRIR
jgi:hypothetical protein